MRRKVVSCFFMACPFLVFLMMSHAADQPESSQAKMMKRKLQLSQEILAAVVTEDFPKMSGHADDLLILAKKQWGENETAEYRSQLKDFWIVLEGLKVAAKEKNGDGATLAYMQMTFSCVKCHKYLRNAEK